MEEEKEEEVREVIIEELKRLGVSEVQRKKKNIGSHQGAKQLLGINTSSNISSGRNSSSSGGNNNFRSKNKKRSPRVGARSSPHSKANTKSKSTPKSPFSSAKRKAENQRKHMKNVKDKVGISPAGQVFGRQLDDIPSVCVYMADGTQVTVAEFLVDVCNLIRRNISVEGIFRKAGSSQRQSDLKKLIDSTGSLPSVVHVIDSACLLKQFLRCLPQPLLPSDVHSKIVKCMDLAEELRIEAVTLCTLLLPDSHRQTLMYLMDFFMEVVAASSSNLMDAHNLAIVLAPNLLPTTITPTSSRKNFQSLPSEDALLTTNIEILQLMIENGALLCRMPTNLALVLEHRERSKSTENLLTSSQPLSASRKKRRSASIHRLMTGLRRVVGREASGTGSPLRPSDSVDYLDTLHHHPGIALSPAPGSSNVSPRKRKSADAFDLCGETPRKAAAAASDAHQISTPPSSKRSKVESEVGVARACATPTATASATSTTATATNMDVTPPVSDLSLPITVVTCPTPNEKPSFKVGQPISLREDQDSRDVLPQQTQRSGGSCLLDDSKSNVKKSLSSDIRTFSKSPGFNLHAVHGSLSRRSFDRIEPLGQPKQVGAYPRAYSQLLSFETPPKKRSGQVKRRSCDVPLNGGAKRAAHFEDPTRVVRRNSFDWRSSGNEPDGADMSTLGPRGIPDGAECNLRDGLLPKPTVSESLDTLEQHYDDIKSVVKTMEAEVDESNVLQMKETYFPNTSLSSQNMSYSEMIQNAYERMKVESKDLGISPSENLSKRLDRELKIRKRRSSEHRVMRSPSERKIGTLRRRSRELVQNAAKSTITTEDTPKVQPDHQTPKMKEHLIQTPVNGSLRRGKPNSVKSGLPFVLRAFSPLQTEEEEGSAVAKSTNRTVVVSKRADDNDVIHRGKASSSAAGSPYYYQPSSLESSGNSEPDSKGSVGDLPSISNVNVSDRSSDENLMDSILELLPGSMTRRRSSLLSSLTSSFPILKTVSSENLGSGGPLHPDGRSYSGDARDVSSELMEVGGMDKEGGCISGEESNVQPSVSFPGAILPQKEEEEEQWIPATEFNYTRDEEEGEQGPQTCDEGSHGRPSLAALMKQKKVTANVQLFSKMQRILPSQQGTSQLRSTPLQSIPPRSSASERRNVRLSYSKSMNSRCTLTPRELLKARQRSFQFDRSPRNLAKIAVVSPLKESTWINIQQEHAQEVPKAYKGEATIPLTPALPGKNFKPPVAPVTPVRSHNQLRIFGANPETEPPKLPPRSSIKPSPIRIQYR